MGADDLGRRVAEMGAAKRKAEVDAIVAERCAPLREVLAELVALRDNPDFSLSGTQRANLWFAAWERARRVLGADE